MTAWIPVTERLPEPGKHVLIFCPGWRGSRLRAMWCPRWTEESCSEDNDNDEYCEEKDQYYVREGWYETNGFEETHWKVDTEPSHWMPMPEPPSEDCSK
jgi:hypothetical protein